MKVLSGQAYKKNIMKNRMVKLLLLFSGMLFLAGCPGSSESVNEGQRNADPASAVQGQPQITFDKDLHPFGTIFSGERVVYSFRFTNTGDAPLIITGTRSSCGCTAGQFTRDPIPPGERGFVSVEFNSAGRNGFQQETLWVQTNAEGQDQRLRITAEVVRN